MVKIFQKELPADCEKAIRELIKLKVYIVMDDDRIENFSDVWWKVQHECDMYEELKKKYGKDWEEEHK